MGRGRGVRDRLQLEALSRTTNHFQHLVHIRRRVPGADETMVPRMSENTAGGQRGVEPVPPFLLTGIESGREVDERHLRVGRQSHR